MENVQETLRYISACFRIEGELVGYEVITIGNINNTYRADFLRSDGTRKSYVLQRVNTYVFKNPEQIMHNIDMVTSHIMQKAADKPRLHFHHTKDGKNFILDGDGSFWRLCNYVDSITYDTCDDLATLEAAGRAFGEFQTQLSDFPADSLFETIPDFHNTKKRLDAFFKDVESDPCGRVEETKAEIDFIKSMREIASRMTDMADRAEIPLRVTHNDTKINNVLFDSSTNRPLLVVDLDTVMPGLAMHDFGDAVRFAASTAGEDEADLSKVKLDMEKFRAFAKGFIEMTAGSFTQAELGTMALGALTIAIELGTRFLDDYITGDRYFKTLYEGHNLVRARCQLQLAKDMLARLDDMNAVISEVAANAVNP